ncbi:hypothetical protein PoB_002664500 [Plakobranchus ocellatus]|uniref:Uncharacterized protein n=1 Tax=Plakobranchus ocellatus TaxID=259542 RepID=A0AAV3ZY62_9GAST|nr:hypothetical protein PoB_002664500 [Plakobranchus ocellatus]
MQRFSHFKPVGSSLDLDFVDLTCFTKVKISYRQSNKPPTWKALIPVPSQPHRRSARVSMHYAPPETPGTFVELPARPGTEAHQEPTSSFPAPPDQRCPQGLSDQLIDCQL